MQPTDKIYVAGHSGMVGSAIKRDLEKRGFEQLIYRRSSALDLRNQQAVNDFFAAEKPTYVFFAAAKVGGIVANNRYRAEFIYDNLIMEANVIEAAYRHGVKKLLFLGSSCIYPKLAPQPLQESYLLSGYLEPTNQPYAIAKIAGIELCKAYRAQYGCNFIAAMPTNLYGPNDNYDPENSHVMAALIRKFVLAKKEGLPQVELWGTGTPKREFLHVEDLAAACYFLMQSYNEEEIINVGTGKDVSIYELALLIKELTEYQGEIVFNPERPDGTPRKLLDISRITQLGWQPHIELKEGVARTIEAYKVIAEQ
jgi:GDP-L-fucose synthase